MLEAIKYIDVVHTFGSRQELEDLIQLYEPDILLLGDDWRDGDVVGWSLLWKQDSFQEWEDMLVVKHLKRYRIYESIINWR